MERVSSMDVNVGSPKSPPNPPTLPNSNDEQPLEEKLHISDSEDITGEKGGHNDDDDDDDDDDELMKKKRQTRFIKDPDGPLTHDKTTVDVVTVPCPGGHAVRSWNRDGLLGRFFGAPSMRDAEIDRPESSPSWARQGIRREADVARILLYEHPPVVEGTTLASLADALLEELYALRSEEDESGGQKQRPVVFLGHSVGGIVVKMALAKASRDVLYDDILRDCYGVAFFGTPHQGSSYFAMPSLAGSIQHLLQLAAPLPTSITDDLRVGNSVLMRADEDFKATANDLRVWTLYETIDSRLSTSAPSDGAAQSGGGGGSDNSIYFTAPLASIKSAILGMRQERIFPLQSDHANVASFGRHNVHTLRLFMRQLSAVIGRADASAREDGEGSRWTLHLEQTVSVEVHGFFEDAVEPDEKMIRAWSTRLPLRDLLAKGPEECLNDRLHDVEGEPKDNQFLRNRGKTRRAFMQPELENLPHVVEAVRHEAGLGIKNQMIKVASPPNSPIIRPVDSPLLKTGGIRSGSAPAVASATPTSQAQRPRRLSSPPPPVGSAAHRMSSSQQATRQSTPMLRPSPLVRADFEQDLAVDRLSPPTRPRSILSIGRSASDTSRGEYRDFPPFSQQRSRSTMDDGLSGKAGFSDESEDEDGSLEASPVLPESVVAIRKVAHDAQRRQSETVIVDEVPAAFSRPEVSARKFVWIHLAYNNPSWVKSIIETLQRTHNRDYSSLFSHEFWQTKHTRGRHSQHYAYYAKPGCYFNHPTRALTPRHSMSPSMSPAKLNDSMFFCLFLPYLHFDSYKRLLRRRDLILSRIARGRARPVPQEVAKADSTELQVIWEFLGHDPPINCRRTLDQFGYPSLRDTRSRDDDQMLYKLTKERGCYGGSHSGDLWGHSETSKAGSHGSGGSGTWRNRRLAGLESLDDSEHDDDDEVLNGNLLMVDQMWLWVIHPHTLLSFFPRRESDPIEGPLYQQADLRDSIFNEVNVDLTGQCENALDLAALSALHAVSVLLERASHPDLEVFRIFDEAISVLTEKLTSSLKTFRMEGFRDKAAEYEPVENQERSIRARHKEEGRRAERDNQDNTSALLELRDIEDELLVLLNLFERQHAVLTSMYTAYGGPSLRDKTVHGRAFLVEAVKRVSEYRRRADDMTQRVRATRDDYDKLLQMVQRQAQVDEVRLSRLHADLASAQSRSVMIFTIFTVIFLPATFFTGLFGMNTREWDGKPPSIKFIGAIALPGSVALVIIALVAAWSNNARLGFAWLLEKCSRMNHMIYVTTLRPVLRKGVGYYRRRSRMKAMRTANNGGGSQLDGGGSGSRLKKETSDFWARHRLERDREYQIPEVNRKQAPPRKRTSGAKGKKESRGRA